MADLELVDALTDAPPQIEPEVKRDFISSLEAETFDDVVGEKCDKTDYIPLLDDDEANGAGDKRPAEGGPQSVLENGEHGTGDVGVSDPFGSACDEDVLADLLLPPQVQICPAFPAQLPDSPAAAFDEGWLTDSYSKSGETDTPSAEASEKTTATYGETPSDESANLPFQVPQSDPTSHIWQPTAEEQIALGSHNAPDHEGHQLTPEESLFDAAVSTESQLLPGLGSQYLEQHDEEDFLKPDPYHQDVTSTSIETPDPTTENYVHENLDNPPEDRQDEAAFILQSAESEQSKEDDVSAEQVTAQTSAEPPPRSPAEPHPRSPVSPFELIEENSFFDQFPAETRTEPVGGFQEEVSAASPASLGQDTESTASPVELVQASPVSLTKEAEVPASPIHKEELLSSPVALHQDEEVLASPVALTHEAEVPSSPVALHQDEEFLASPVVLMHEAEVPVSPCALAPKAPASPIAVSDEAEVPASPVALAHEAPPSPVELTHKEEVPSSPAEVLASCEAEVPESTVALTQEAETPESPTVSTPKAEVLESHKAEVVASHEAEVPESHEPEVPVSPVALVQDVGAPASPATLPQELETPAPLAASTQEETTLASPVSQGPAETLTPIVTEGNLPPGGLPEQTPLGRDDLQHPGDQAPLKQHPSKTSDRRPGRAKTALAPISGPALEPGSPSPDPTPTQAGHSESLASRAKALHKKAHDMMESRREAARDVGDPEGVQMAMKKKKKKTKQRKNFAPKEVEFGEEDVFSRSGGEAFYTGAGPMGHVEPLTRQDHLLEKPQGITRRETLSAANGTEPAANVTAAESALESVAESQGDPTLYSQEKPIPAPQNIDSSPIRHAETPPGDQADKSLFEAKPFLLGESGKPDTSIFGTADTDVTKCPYLHPEILFPTSEKTLKAPSKRDEGLWEPTQSVNKPLDEAFPSAGAETVKWDKPKKRDKRAGNSSRGGHVKDPKQWQKGLDNLDLAPQTGAVPLYPEREEKPLPLVIPLDDLQKSRVREQKVKSKNANKNLPLDLSEPLSDFGHGLDLKNVPRDLLAFEEKPAGSGSHVLLPGIAPEETDILASSLPLPVGVGEGLPKVETPCTPLTLTDTVVGLVLGSIEPTLKSVPENDSTFGEGIKDPILEKKTEKFLDSKVSTPETKPEIVSDGKGLVPESKADPVLSGKESLLENKSDGMGLVPEGKASTVQGNKEAIPESKPSVTPHRDILDFVLAITEPILESKTGVTLDSKEPAPESEPGTILDRKEHIIGTEHTITQGSKEPALESKVVLGSKESILDDKPAVILASKEPSPDSKAGADLGGIEPFLQSKPVAILGSKEPVLESESALVPKPVLGSKDFISETEPLMVLDSKVSPPELKPGTLRKDKELVPEDKFDLKESIPVGKPDTIVSHKTSAPETEPWSIWDSSAPILESKPSADLGGKGSPKKKSGTVKVRKERTSDNKHNIVQDSTPLEILDLQAPTPENKPDTVLGDKEVLLECKPGSKELAPEQKGSLVVDIKEPLPEGKADAVGFDKVQDHKVDDEPTMLDSQVLIPENKPVPENLPEMVLENKDLFPELNFSSFPPVPSYSEPMSPTGQPLSLPKKGQADEKAPSEKQVKGKRGKIKSKSNSAKSLFDTGEQGLEILTPSLQPSDQPLEANLPSTKKAERGSLKRPHSSEKKESPVLVDVGLLSGRESLPTSDPLVPPPLEATLKGPPQETEPVEVVFDFPPCDLKSDRPEQTPITAAVVEGLNDDILILTGETTQGEVELKTDNVIFKPCANLSKSLGEGEVRGAHDGIAPDKPFNDFPVSPVEEITFGHSSDIHVPEKPHLDISGPIEGPFLTPPGLLDFNSNVQEDFVKVTTPILEASWKTEELDVSKDVLNVLDVKPLLIEEECPAQEQQDEAKTLPAAPKASIGEAAKEKTKTKTSPPAPGLKKERSPIEKTTSKTNKAEEKTKAPEVLKGYMRPTKARSAAPPPLSRAVGLAAEKPKPPKETRLRPEKGKSETVAAPEAKSGSDISAPPTKELPASPEKKVKAAAVPSKAAAPPKGKPLAAPSPRKPLSATPTQPKKASSPATAGTNNNATPKRPLGSATKTTTPKEAKPKSLDAKSPVKTPDKKPLSSVTTPRPAVKASPTTSRLSTSAATTGAAAPKPNVTPKRPTSLKNDVKAAEAKKTSAAKSPSELSRPKSVPTDPTKNNGAAPASPGPAPSRPKTSKPAAPKTLTGPSASTDAKKQPAARPPPLSKTSALPASKPSSASGASKPTAAPKQPRPATAPDLKNVRSKIGSTDNLKHQPGGGKQVKVEKKPLPLSTARKPVPAPAATKSASTKPADPKETAQKQSNGKVQIVSKKVNYSHVQSKCGSKDNIKHVPGGGNVTNAAKPSVGSSRAPSSTSHKPGAANVQILSKKVDVSKVSSKCGSKPNAKGKTGGGDAKSEASTKTTETTKQEPQDSIKENGGDQITAQPQNGDLVTPTDSTAVDTQENGVEAAPPIDGSNQREIQSFNSLIPETN
ncbi:uncharacterized protein RB166_006561 isoform 2-T2 [Leptodactylus fuscus]|uniref:uncharacterized protein LOC142201037 isoform X2 n=1 Tax=Leptodactylus fuscus TaxID=238119 RepID=UPI003F4EA5D5